MLAIQLDSPSRFVTRPWALSHRSCESEIKLSPKLPTDVELEDHPCFKSPVVPPPLCSFYSNQIVSVAALSSFVLHLTGSLCVWVCVSASNRLFTLSLSCALQIEFELMPLTRPAATSLPSPPRQESSPSSSSAVTSSSFHTARFGPGPRLYPHPSVSLLAARVRTPD